MQRVIPRFSILAVAFGTTGLFAIGYPAEVRAQTIFCPATFSGVPVVLSDGSCTDGNNGAFSGAALASQALTELSQTTTEVTTKELGKAIVERREQERERMRRPVPPARAVPREKPKPAEVVRKEPPPTSGPVTDRACRPIWNLDSSLWRLSEEGHCWGWRPKLLHYQQCRPRRPQSRASA